MPAGASWQPDRPGRCGRGRADWAESRSAEQRRAAEAASGSIEAAAWPQGVAVEFIRYVEFCGTRLGRLSTAACAASACHAGWALSYCRGSAVTQLPDRPRAAGVPLSLLAAAAPPARSGTRAVRPSPHADVTPGLHLLNTLALTAALFPEKKTPVRFLLCSAERQRRAGGPWGQSSSANQSGGLGPQRRGRGFLFPKFARANSRLGFAGLRRGPINLGCRPIGLSAGPARP